MNFWRPTLWEPDLWQPVLWVLPRIVAAVGTAAGKGDARGSGESVANTEEGMKTVRRGVQAREAERQSAPTLARSNQQRHDDAQSLHDELEKISGAACARNPGLEGPRKKSARARAVMKEVERRIENDDWPFRKDFDEGYVRKHIR